MVLGAFHNGMNPEEVERLRFEHPGEPEVVTKDRVLGAIAVTRGKKTTALWLLSHSMIHTTFISDRRRRVQDSGSLC